MTQTVANTLVSNSFEYLRNRTNELAYAIGSQWGALQKMFSKLYCKAFVAKITAFSAISIQKVNLKNIISDDDG